jgi:3-methyladenine DNA glycosylase AlkD
MSIMAKQYALKGTTPGRKQALFDLYLRRHDRINNWDLVDLAAWNVIGPHLVDRPRDVLYRLAKSANLWERRTAIYSTYAFIKRGDYDDALTIAEMFVSDREDLIHKATGGMLRAIGDKGRERLIAFLEAHAATMPRVMLRYAIEKFTPEERKMWMARGR